MSGHPKRISVSSSDTGVNCKGIYVLQPILHSGAPCYTRESGTGGIYFDGTYWKICQEGTGASPNGWNFSQRGESGTVPVGQWDRDKRNQGESSRDYSGLVLTVVDESGAGSDAPSVAKSNTPSASTNGVAAIRPLGSAITLVLVGTDGKPTRDGDATEVASAGDTAHQAAFIMPSNGKAAINVTRWLESVKRAGYPLAVLTDGEGRAEAALAACAGEVAGSFAVAVVSMAAALQLEWGLRQRDAAWSTRRVLASAPGAPPPESSEALLRSHGAKLGLEETQLSEYVRMGSADPTRALSAIVSHVVTSVSMDDLGMGAPLDAQKVPWLVYTLIGFLGSRLAETAHSSQRAWALLPEGTPPTDADGEATRKAVSAAAPAVSSATDSDMGEVTPSQLRSSSADSALHKLFDGSRSSYWESNSDHKPHWIEMRGFGGELCEFELYEADHNSYSLRNIKVSVQRGGTSSWHTLVSRQVSRRSGGGGEWCKLLTPTVPGGLADVTAIRFESTDGHGVNCRITSFRVRVQTRPALCVPSSAALAPRCRERVAPAALSALQAALSGLAMGKADAQLALETLKSDPEVHRAAYALLLDFLRSLPSAPLSKQLETVSEAAAWRRQCVSRLLVPSAKARQEAPSTKKHTKKHTRETGTTPATFSQDFRLSPFSGSRWHKNSFNVEYAFVGFGQLAPSFPRFALEIKSVHANGTVQLGRIAFEDAQGNELPYSSFTINEERCHSDESYRNLQADDRRKWCAELAWFPSQQPRFEFTFDTPVCIRKVVLTTANDEPQRDPAHFTLMGIAHADSVRVAHNGWYTVGLPEAARTSGLLYYELTLHSTGRTPQLGWATAGFGPTTSGAGSKGAGDDLCSWAADGARGKLWHNGAREWPGLVRWVDGDVIGCAADLTQGKLWFGKNGEWIVGFEECRPQNGGLYPAMSGSSDLQFSVNTTPRYPGPTSSFVNVADGTLPKRLDMPVEFTGATAVEAMAAARLTGTTAQQGQRVRFFSSDYSELKAYAEAQGQKYFSDAAMDAMKSGNTFKVTSVKSDSRWGTGSLTGSLCIDDPRANTFMWHCGLFVDADAAAVAPASTPAPAFDFSNITDEDALEQLEAALPPVALVQYLLAAMSALPAQQPSADVVGSTSSAASTSTAAPKAVPATSVSPPRVYVRLRLLVMGQDISVGSRLAVSSSPGHLALAEHLGEALGGGSTLASASSPASTAPSRAAGCGPDLAATFLLAASTKYGALRRSAATASKPGANPFADLIVPPPMTTSYKDNDGDDVSFKLEGGKMIKYVNGSKSVGRSDSSGVVTALKINRPFGSEHFDVRDQGGFGSNDFPSSVVEQLRTMASKAGITCSGNAAQGPVAAPPVPLSSPQTLGKIQDFWSRPLTPAAGQKATGGESAADDAINEDGDKAPESKAARKRPQVPVGAPPAISDALEVSALAAADMAALESCALASPLDTEAHMKPLDATSPLSTFAAKQYYYSGFQKPDANMEQAESLRMLVEDDRCGFARLSADSGALQLDDDSGGAALQMLADAKGGGRLQCVHKLTESLRALLVQSSHWLAAQLLLRTHGATRERVLGAYASEIAGGDAEGGRAQLLQRLLLTNGPETVAQLTEMEVHAVEAAHIDAQAIPPPMLTLACCLMFGEVPPIGMGSMHSPSAFTTALAVMAAAPADSLLVDGMLNCPNVFLPEATVALPLAVDEGPAVHRWQPETLSNSPGQHTLPELDGRVLKSSGSNKTLVGIDKVLTRGQHEIVFQWRTDSNFGGGLGFVLEDKLSSESFPIGGDWISTPPRGLWWLRNFSSRVYCNGTTSESASSGSLSIPCEVRFNVDMDKGEAIVHVAGERRATFTNITGPVRPCAIFYDRDDKEVELISLTSAGDGISTSALHVRAVTRTLGSAESAALFRLGAWLYLRHTAAAKRRHASRTPIDASSTMGSSSADDRSGDSAIAPVPVPITAEVFELLCARLGRSSKFSASLVTPLENSSDCRLVLSCLAQALKTAGTPLAATSLHGDGGGSGVRDTSVRLPLSQLVAPPILKSSDMQTPAHPMGVQAQAVPLLYLLASGDPRAQAVVPTEWRSVGDAMALMRSVYTRVVLPPAVLAKATGTFANDEARAAAENLAWSMAMDKQLTRLVQARQKAKAVRLGASDAEMVLSDMQEAVASVLPDNGLYNHLQPLSAETLHARSQVLAALNDACFEHLLPWVDLSETGTAGTLAHELCELKPLLHTKRKQTVFTKLLNATNRSASQHQLVFDRREAARAVARNTATVDAASAIAAAEAEAAAATDPAEAARAEAARAQTARAAEAAAETAGDEFGGGSSRASTKPLTMFEQFCIQVSAWHSSATEPLASLRDLLHSEKAFNVNFTGEPGSDAGGLYRETLDSLVTELHSRALPLLVPTPNESQTGQDVYDRGRWMLNPAPPTPETLWQLSVMGALIGLCLRSRTTLPFELAHTVWQGLLGETPTLQDYELVDKAQADFVAHVRDNSDPNCPNMDEELFNAIYGELVDFTLARSDQQAKAELKPGGTSQQLTYATRHEWAALAEAYLVHECDAQLAALRSGLAQVVPLESLLLFTAAEFERIVIGDKDWSVNDLKRGAEVRGQHQVVGFLWEVLGELTPEEKALFCRFAWGRSRMPERCAGVRMKVELVPLRAGVGQLPVSHTCFFQLDLPRYTSKAMLKEKLLCALYYCKDFDLV